MLASRRSASALNMRSLGVLLMAVALAMLMAMVVGVMSPGLGASFLSYGLLLAGVFCFSAGVMKHR